MPPSKLRENHFGTAELQWPAHLGQGRRADETSGTGETGGKGETLGIRALRIAPVSLDMPVVRLRPLTDFFSILMEPVTGVDDVRPTRGLIDRHRS